MVTKIKESTVSKPGRSRKSRILALGILILFLVSACFPPERTQENETGVPVENSTVDFPKIASWLAKKDEIIASGQPYDLVMTGWVTPEEAEQIKAMNPDVVLLVGLSANWIWANDEWLAFLEAVASYGQEPMTVSDEMYLYKSNGEKCAFGWASEDWGHEELYAMDPRNPVWVELITSFYRNALAQPQHDGIIFDMVVEENYWCPDAISRAEWLQATTAIYESVQSYNTQNKMVVFNAGKDYSDIDEYSQYFDGYLMENFMGKQMGTTFEDGLRAASGDKFVIFNADTDDSGEVDMNKMRLGLTLSLLNDNSYFTYDIGPRDHGQAWWFPEYDVELGNPLGGYYEKDGAYWREFENGVVVSSPNAAVNVDFDREYSDSTTNVRSTSFSIEKGDGRIFIR